MAALLGTTGSSACRAETPTLGGAFAGLNVAVSGHGAQPFTSLLGKSATAVVFLSVACPISNGYSADLAALAAANRARGAAMILVYSNAEDIPEAPAHVKKFGLSGMTVVLDADQRIAEALHARITPQAFVLDAAGKVCYSGRIDDRYIDRGKPTGTAARSRDLAAALQAVINHTPITRPVTQPFGCLIELRVKAHPMTATYPTYARDVAPILNKNCAGCHRAGEYPPMPFTSYAEAKRYAANIVSVTERRFMPPWKPVAGYGDFKDERHLTDAEIKTLRDWAEAGAPAGENMPAPHAAPPAAEWALGKPDLILAMPEAFTIPASGPDWHRCFVLPTNLTEDQQVIAVEFHPGNKKAARHIETFIDTSGAARQLLETPDGLGPGYMSFGGPGFPARGELGLWAPGKLPQRFSNHFYYFLPAKSEVVLQVFYHPTGRTEQDRTQIGLYFSRDPAAKRLRTLALAPTHFTVPEYEKNYVAEKDFTLPFDVHAVSIRPHMHLLGKTISVDATLPDGTEQHLLRIDDWDYNWQDSYTFKNFVRLPKGTHLHLRATFDNSAENPRQPSQPPARVGWGRHVTDEMCVAYLTYSADDESDPLVQMIDGVAR
jgi:mono/diheme cytochrome c family protein